MIKRIPSSLGAILCLALLLASCAQPAPSGEPAAVSMPTVQGETPATALVGSDKTLSVFAAASLTEAFTELGKLFEEQNPGLRLSFNFAGSQQLAQQLGQDAPADVFASANQVQMEAVIGAGRVSTDQVRALCGNKLVVIFAKFNPGKLYQLKDLEREGLKLVLADAAVPAGQYSLEFLDKASKLPEYGETFKANVLKNVVSYEENIRSVLTKVALGEADAGIVYASDLSTPQGMDVGVMEIPSALNIDALYTIAPVQNSSQAALAAGFVEIALSQAGQEILARYGFKMVQ
ncbi:MAG: molybdate ABC transporter substrate-binding protein [Anaerolineales bacterium]|jgi:molybdate transport system substrate-binding protein|nr:molybdate ABC transporter substrate-binding protein [Anaerolineales bacterium]